jgi:glycosyltransferase involved in cell wall biosynthesis
METVLAGARRSAFRPGLTVFFPAYNDARSLPDLLAKTFATLQSAASDYEVIVVNDGSTDDTASVLTGLQQQYGSRLQIVTHHRNRGYGAALRSGFAAASKEFVFYTDGDGQYDPSDLPDLLAAVTPEVDWVNGYKANRSDPWRRVAIGKTYNWVVRRLFGIRLRDIDCDFRLIRRSKLDLGDLRSTSGTICIELARSLERAGSKLVELPVRHYPRLHGQSEFFRIRPLVRTFQQLSALYWSQVFVPALTHPGPWMFACMALVLTALSFLTYARSLSLPFISDDYLQIHLGREYGAMSGWPALFSDALYRCRATSLVITYWTERAFGLDPLPYRISALIVHILNSCLVLGLGFWRPIGWKLSIAAACFFAVSQRHSEAVIWYAALPELLVFFFGLGSFLAWIRWLHEDRHRVAAYAASLACYFLALLSKESAVAVVPLCLLAVWVQPSRRKNLEAWLALAPFVLGAGAYFYLAFLDRGTHLHFNDGTFSLAAPFLATLVRSSANLLWIWGLGALVLIAFLERTRWRTMLLIAAVWMPVTLLPYSFLTYMNRVPSRHTYWASVAVALVVAAGLITLRQWSGNRGKPWLAPFAAAVIMLHQAGYIWGVKHIQYALRAEPTEGLVRVGLHSPGPIYAKCFPYPVSIGEQALQIRSADAILITGADARERSDAIDFCNVTAHE